MMGSMMRRGSFGDGSTLDLDFTSMSSTADLTAVGMTFSRSTSATYLNASGTVVTASANQARFNYTTAGAKRGLLFEGSATNLLCHSTRLDDAQVGSEQYWVTTYSATGSTSGITGPDGVANSATQFAPIGSNGTCIASAAMGTSAQRTFSFWARQSSGSTNLEYTLDNGTNWTAVTTTSSWQRFTIAATTAAQRVGFRFAANNIYEIWGCQLETGNDSSSTIVTTTSAVTRGADYAWIDGTAFSNAFPLGLNTYSVLWSGDASKTVSASTFLFLLRTGSGGSGTSQGRGIITSGGVIQFVESNGAGLNSGLSATKDATLKIATASNATTQSLATNNGSTTSLVTLTSSLTSFASTQVVFNPNGDNFYHVKQLKFYQSKLDNTTLQGLVA